MSANTGFGWKWSNRQAIFNNEQVELALPKIKLLDNQSSTFMAPPMNIYFTENTGIYKWSTPLEAQLKNMFEDLEKEIEIFL